MSHKCGLKMSYSHKFCKLQKRKLYLVYDEVFSKFPLESEEGNSHWNEENIVRIKQKDLVSQLKKLRIKMNE